LVKYKPKIAVFSFTCCSGCQLQLLNIDEAILDLLRFIDIAHFRMIQDDNLRGPFDVAFVEGSISTPREAEMVAKIRESSKFLVALGTCACWGNIQAIRNYRNLEDFENTVYGGQLHLPLTKASGIDEYIKVDYYLRGCPINEKEFLHVIKEILVGKIPKEPNYSVCVECKLKENICVIKEGKVCVGPITYAGCDAICPTNRLPCDGCRGPLNDANVGAEIELFREYGVDVEEIKRKLLKFAPNARILLDKVKL
jgi:coenzyme F420-reducing hydrogenase gamma subunit